MSSMSFLFETFMKIFFEDNIFRAVLDSQQNQEEGTEISHKLSASRMHRLPHPNIPTEWCICYTWWTCTGTS